MIVQRLIAASLLTTSVASVAQYAPYPPPYSEPAYQQGYAQQGYYADGQPVASIDNFYEPLSRYGRWIESRWGRAFEPLVARGWRPYTIGRWEDSPVYGRTWRSDEPFGWATYHYGRWGFDQRYGWVWVPDTVWGPGWVAWRDGDDFAGWAPLPPQVSVSFGISLGSGFDRWNYDRWYEPSWVYVPRDYAYGRPVYNVILPYQRNHEFWEHTRGVTHYDRDGDHIVNRSFDHDRGRDFGRDQGHDSRSDGHDRQQRGFIGGRRDEHVGSDVRTGDGRRNYDQRANNDRSAEVRPGGSPIAVHSGYGQPHYRQFTSEQPGSDPRGGPSFYGRPATPAVSGGGAAIPGGAVAPQLDPRAAYASRDRVVGNPNGAAGGQRPDWERRREQTFQPATGGNVPPFNRGERGRPEGYGLPPMQYGRAPGAERPRAGPVAPPAAAFARPAAPFVQPAPAPPRAAPAPRPEPQRANRGENVKPQ